MESYKKMRSLIDDGIEILDSVEYKNEKRDGVPSLTLCAKLLRGRFANRIWAPIRNDQRFIEAIDSMAKY